MFFEVNDSVVVFVAVIVVVGEEFIFVHVDFYTWTFINVEVTSPEKYVGEVVFYD